MGRDGLVVVTGAGGIVGQGVLGALAGRYRLRAVDRRYCPAPAGVEVVRADLRRRRAVAAAVAGADVVVHLAAVTARGGSGRDATVTDPSMAAAVLQAAGDAGARRVVLASSIRVMAGHWSDEPYRRVVRGEVDGFRPGDVPLLGVDDPVRPDGAYARGKVRIEELGRAAAERGPCSVVCLRLGTVREGDRSIAPRDACCLLTHRDAAALLAAAIDAPDEVRFAVAYGASARRWRIWDPAPAAALGFEPADDAYDRYDDDAHRAGSATGIPQLLQLTAERPSNRPIDRLQHSLQVATRARAAGADDDLVAAALVHDLGVAGRNARHGPASAALVTGYLPPRAVWVVKVHEDFTARYGPGTVLQHRRLRWRWHPWYRLAARFADEWDRHAWDPDHPPLAIEDFEPLLERYFDTSPRPPAWERAVRRIIPEIVRDVLARRHRSGRAR